MLETHNIVYHAHCDDGFGAAWAARKYFESIGKLHLCRFMPWDYNTPVAPTFGPRDNVYILDFSFKRKILEEMVESAASLIVLDHHKSAAEDLAGFKRAIFDMNRSGAMMTWNYFHGTKAPVLLQFVQDNDLYRHQLPHCKSIIRFIRSYPHDFVAWDQLDMMFNTQMLDVTKQAHAIERYFNNQIDFIVHNASLHRIFGGSVPVVNCVKTFASEICHVLMHRFETSRAISWFQKDNHLAEMSVRGNGVVDVSQFAKQFGGGGHRNASGFAMPTVDWVELLEQTRLPDGINK